MKQVKFLVERYERCMSMYKVSAVSKADAAERALKGEGEFVVDSTEFLEVEGIKSVEELHDETEEEKDGQ